MCTDETTTYESPDDSSQGTYESPDGSEQGTYEAPGDGAPGWSRRTFLKAAALGTAAAALVNLGSNGGSFGPLSAFASPDTSDLNCNAGDVQLLGALNIINEDCNCGTGSTFTALATAVLRNNAESTRYCIIAHLPPVTATIGGTVTVIAPANNPNGDLNLTGSISGKSTATVTVSIPNYPCGAGTLTFGNPTSGPADKPNCDVRPCAAISWLTPSDRNTDCTTVKHSDIPPSKCRFQQVQIVGREANLVCVESADSDCTPTCGGTSRLVASVSGGNAPYVLSLVGGASSTALSGTGHTASFLVTTTATTTYTVLATSDAGTAKACTKTLTRVIEASPLPSFSPTTSLDQCSGQTTITASVSGADTYVFSDGSGPFATASSTPATATRLYTPTTAGAQTHTIAVLASNAAGCTSPGTCTVTINQAVSLSLSASAAGTCAALSASDVTLTATGSGGVAPYVYTWTLDGSEVRKATLSSADSYTYSANADATAHTVAVSCIDSNSCSSTPSSLSKTISQCVNTTVS